MWLANQCSIFKECLMRRPDFFYTKTLIQLYLHLGFARILIYLNAVFTRRYINQLNWGQIVKLSSWSHDPTRKYDYLFKQCFNWIWNIIESLDYIASTEWNCYKEGLHFLKNLYSVEVFSCFTIKWLDFFVLIYWTCSNVCLTWAREADKLQYWSKYRSEMAFSGKELTCKDVKETNQAPALCQCYMSLECFNYDLSSEEME